MTPEAQAAFCDGIAAGRQRRRFDVEHACLLATMMLEVVVIQHGTARLLRRIDAELLNRLGRLPIPDYPE